jgi:DNA-binding transcriptional MerR regulator
MLLTKSDICEVTGLTHDQFEAWCRQGVIQPVNAGRGRGNHRRFGLVQATALIYAFQWKRCGASLSTMRDVIACVTQYTEDELQAELRKGNRIPFLVPGQTSRLWPVPASMTLPDLLDLEWSYTEAAKRIARIERRLGSESTVGRRRGLARSSNQ